MEEEELQAIENLYARLPKPPWSYSLGSDYDHWELWSETDEEHLVVDDSGVRPSTEFLEFISRAREDIPKLIKEIRRLKESQPKEE